MPQRRIIIPTGCAESACPKHSAHPLGLSAHLEMRKLLAFLSCCGARGASDLVGSPSYNHQLTNFHTSMSQRCIIIPGGCAESACLKHSAHPLGLSAHLEMQKLQAFLCGCGHLRRSDLVGSPSYNHQLTNFHTSISQRCIIIPGGCPESACLKHSAHPLGLSAHLEMQKLQAFLCGCGHLRRSDPVGSPSYNHQLTNFHSSMSQRRIIIPTGCAESTCPKD
jgi:CDGSH-type Zn-finger protein